jgi:hypothetical protein
MHTRGVLCLFVTGFLLMGCSSDNKTSTGLAYPKFGSIGAGWNSHVGVS